MMKGIVYFLSTVWLMFVLSVSYEFDPTRSSHSCTLEMYGNDTAAYWACQIQFAHQSNWFPSPIAGLFSYQAWNGYDGFWQNGVILETFINFMAYTNKTHTRYRKVLMGSERPLYSLEQAYGPYPSFDDMAWYGLAYARIHEVLAPASFLKISEDIFTWIWQTGWDTSGVCGGGFWFDNTFASKQTIANAQMLQFAARLARITKKKEYVDKMHQVYHYIQKNALINDMTYLVSDAASINCTGTQQYGKTYDSGTMLGAFVEMYRITKDAKLLDIAHKMAFALIQRNSDPNGVLVEFCEPYCDDDAITFKGIFVRNVRYLLDELHDPYILKYFRSWLNLQVHHNLQYNMCDAMPISKCNITFKDGPPYYNKSGPVFSYDWRGPFRSGAPMQQSSALDLFISAIQPGTTCRGKMCSYDPYYPPPQTLTCADYPCPSDQDCCEYSIYSSYTCCESSQICNNVTGICT